MKYFVCPNEDRSLDAASRSALRGSFIKLSDGVTQYELTGPEDGDVLILVGGLTVTLFYWDRLVLLLHKAGFRTLAYSSYGRGYSDRVEGPYNDALFVRQLTELVRSLKLTGQQHIVGASMGALIAMGYVSQHAASVATLTVAGPAGLAKKPMILRVLLRNAGFAGLVAKYLGRKWLARHEANDLGDLTHAAELSAMLHDAYRYEGSLHAIFDTVQNFRLFDRANLYQSMAESGVPTMLLWGQEDRVTPIDKIDSARALLQPQRCQVFDCGHMVPFERTQDAADSITSFVAINAKEIVS